MIKAAIFGCESTELTDGEKSFFERTQPLGLILFERNCENPLQLKNLITSAKEATGRSDLHILIDREGGRINRLNTKHWRTAPAPRSFGDIYEKDEDLACQSAYENALLMGSELKKLGVSVNCTPLGDLPVMGGHDIIGTRAFSFDMDAVSNLCLSVIEGMQDMGITPILKHMPGHGRATVDSHIDLPHVTADSGILFDTDFECFRRILKGLHNMLRPAPWGMTAHVVYDAIDHRNPATFSSKVIDYVIRGDIDFPGFLITDCLTMNALSGSMAERATQALDAGCNAVLHCNGHLDEMVDIASVTPFLTDDDLNLLADSKPTDLNKTLDVPALELNVLNALQDEKEYARM